MSRDTLVSDTGPLSYCVAGEIFQVLKNLFAGRLYVPPTAISESRKAPQVGRAVVEALREGWLLETHLSLDELVLAEEIRETYGVHKGEAEALAVASVRGLVLICDEKAGRAAARELGIRVTGTMGVLYKAVESGLLTASEADLAIARMRAANQWVPVERYGDVKAFVEADPIRAEWLRNL